MSEDKIELNYGKLRRNDWKWNPQIDEFIELYKDKLCECGCGGKIILSRKSVRDLMYKKRIPRVLPNHYSKLPEAKKNHKKGKDHPMFGKHHSEETLAKLSASLKGREVWNKGIPNPSFQKEKNPNWRGGTSSERNKAWITPEYKTWRTSIFQRDDYTCQICKLKGGKLEADHIKPWSLFPELRFDINNGRTLCKDCHRKYGWNLFKEKNPMKKSNKQDIR